MSQKHQTIFRNARADTGYTIISTLLLNDDELSADALALAVAIISKPITWEFNLAWARKRFDWGETKSERTARELIARGFARKHRHREPDGTLGPMVYEFTDVPHKFSKSDQPAINAERPKDIRNQAAKTTERPNLPAENHSAENLPADSAAHINNRDLENTDFRKKPPTPFSKGAVEVVSKSMKDEAGAPEAPPRRPKRISREDREAARAAKYAEEWAASDIAIAAAIAARKAKIAQEAEERTNGRR